jgi:hypothetical protein
VCRDRLKSRGRLTLVEAVQLATELGDALAYATRTE